MPGTGKTTPTRRQVTGLRRPWLFFQDPTGCCHFVALPSRTDTSRSSANLRITPRAACTWCAGRCRFGLASVSAFEHPGHTVGDRGLLDHFRGLGAP
jgi:hypothetical protein